MGKLTFPFVGMIMAEFAQVGLIILSKHAMAQGMTNFIFIFYSNAFGYAGIYYGSATLSTSMLNLVPAFTFVLAVLFSFLKVLIIIFTFHFWFVFGGISGAIPPSTLASDHHHNSDDEQSGRKVGLLEPSNYGLTLGYSRMEQLDWRKFSSLAKSLGTIVSIAGALVVTLYKGPALLRGVSSANSSQQPLFSEDSNWILAGVFLVADCVMASAYIIVQASILKKYPAELIVVFFYCLFVAIQSAVTCLVVERDTSAWSLEPKLRLLTVLYSGIIGYAFQVGVISWCLQQTGPVFVSMFKPLGIVISVVLGVLFLGDAFYLGSLIGATAIVVGFYSVLWGKAKDIEDAGVRSLESKGNQTPFLEENSY